MLFGSFYGQILECHGDSLQQVVGRLELHLSLHTSLCVHSLGFLSLKLNLTHAMGSRVQQLNTHTMAIVGFIGAKCGRVPANHIGLS